jgi:hypothetical protein
MRFLPGGQPVVEHDARAPERPRQGLLLSWCRVEAVVIPEPHTKSVIDLMFECSDIHADSYRVFPRHLVS